MCQPLYRVTLSDDERSELNLVVNAKKTGLMKRRHAMMLKVLDENVGGPKLSDDELGSAFTTTGKSVYNLRKRFVEEGFEVALEGKPRDTAPTPQKVDGRLEAHLIAMCCSKAPAGYANWTLRLLGDRLVELGYVETISHETVRQTLKKTTSSPGK